MEKETSCQKKGGAHGSTQGVARPARAAYGTAGRHPPREVLRDFQEQLRCVIPIPASHTPCDQKIHLKISETEETGWTKGEVCGLLPLDVRTRECTAW